MNFTTIWGSMILFCGYFWESREKYILIQKLKNVKNWFKRLWCADFGKSETVVGHILQSGMIKAFGLIECLLLTQTNGPLNDLI